MYAKQVRRWWLSDRQILNHLDGTPFHHSATLISFDLCSFVQRSTITLQEKGVEYDIQYVDLANKPEWFLEMNPQGKVPVLTVGDTVVFESAAINEYLDEVYGPQLHPVDPLAKAVHRSWIEIAGQLGGPGYALMTADDEAAARAATSRVRPTLEILEKKVKGPFFAGEAWSLVGGSAETARRPHGDHAGGTELVGRTAPCLTAQRRPRVSTRTQIDRSGLSHWPGTETSAPESSSASEPATRHQAEKS